MRSIINILFCLAVSIFFLYKHLNQDTQMNIITLEGTISDYQRSGQMDFRITMEESACLFRIAPEQWWLFDKGAFEKTWKKGDSISLEVLSEGLGKCGAMTTMVEILGITLNGKTYLDNRAVLAEKDTPVLMIMAVGFFLFSGFLLLLRIKGLDWFDKKQ